MRLLAIALACLLLANVAAVEPNQRVSPVLSMDSDLNAIAVGGDGRIVAGTDDPGSDDLADDPNEIVWRMWNNAGLVENSGTADASDCDVDPFNACTSHVVAVAGNDDGRRFAIAATDDDGESGRLLFLSAPQGQVERLELPGAITAMAMTPTGSHVAVTLSVPDVLGGRTGQLDVYAWADTVSLSWTTELDEVATEVGLSADADVAFVGGSDHLRVRSSSSTTYNLISGVRAIAASDTATHWSIAGYQTGDWAVFSDESDNDPYAPVFSQRPETNDVTAVAMTLDGKYWAVGHDSGTLRLYANRDLVQPSTATPLLGMDTLPGGIQQLAFSADGMYLLAGGGGKMMFYYVDHSDEDPSEFTGLRPYFGKELGGTISGVGMDLTADQLVVGYGDQVAVFTAIEDVSVQGPPAAGAIRDGEGALEVTYTNDGNRFADVRLSLTGQGDWDATLTPNRMGLHPGESFTAVVTVSAPTNSSVESRVLQLEHRVNGGERLNTPLPFQVNQVHFWAIEPEGTFNSAIQAGSSVTFQAKVSNLGNGLDQTDLIVSTDESGWMASVSPDSLSLQSKDSAIVQVTLTAPTSALDLDAGRATLRLSADSTAYMTFTASVGARYGLSAEAVLVNSTGAWPGGSAFVEIRVQNTGNAVDMVRLEAPQLPTDWKVQYRNDQDTHFVLDLQPGANRVEPAEVLIASYAQSTPRDIVLRATSLGNTSISIDLPLTIDVGLPPVQPLPNVTDNNTSEPPNEKSPGLGLVASLLAVAIVARRRSLAP